MGSVSMNYLTNLLGPNAPLAATFIVAFAAVLVLIGLTAWIFRLLRGRGLGIGSGGRGRQPRLAVLDYADVDQRLGDIDRKAAIDELEVQSFAGRGDDVEARTLALLAKLQADQGQFREAFTTMRLAMRVHPRAEAVRASTSSPRQAKLCTSSSSIAALRSMSPRRWRAARWRWSTSA